jgi:hypothetical protein
MEAAMSESIDLRPCPFCGGKAAFGTVTYGEKTVAYQHWDQDTFHKINCIICGTDNCGLVGHRTQSDAAEHWNKRATDGALQAEE